MRAIYSVVVAAIVACGGSPTSRTLGNAASATSPDVASDSTLALFDPSGGACVLRRVDPVARTSVELARFPHECFGASIAWRADLRRAVVWFRPGHLHIAGFGTQGGPAPGHPDEEHEITERRYEVDLVTHAVAPIVAPAVADRGIELAYGKDGALLAFVEHELPNAAGTKVTFEGRVLDFTHLGEGLPAAAVTYRHDPNGWKLTNAVATTIGWDYARGWSAAPEAADIGPRSDSLLETHAETTEIASPAIRSALDRIARPVPDGDGWAQLATAHGPIYIWMFQAEFVSTTGRIAWPADGAIALLPQLGFTGGELVAVATRGRYLLVAGPNAGAYPRLYDLVEHRVVFGSETARAVTLWPRDPVAR